MAGKNVTFTMPSDLVRRVKRLPAGERSAFVARAIERELDQQDAITAMRPVSGEGAFVALERLRKRRTWDKRVSLEIKKHRRLIKRYSGKAKPSDFDRS